MKRYLKNVHILTGALMLVAALALSGAAQGHQHGQEEGAKQSCPGCQGKGRMGQGQMGKGQMGMGRGQGRPEDMETIHALFNDHEKVKRSVKKIDGGVETITESDDPKVQALITEHVWAMKARLERSQPIRMWDPLFVELFKHADKIKMDVTHTAKGVKVTETSTDPYVVKLIQAHADGVSEFVEVGMPSMHKRHELPGAEPEKAKFLGKGDGITTCPVTGEPVNKEVSATVYGRTVYFCCPSCRDAVVKNPELYLKP